MLINSFMPATFALKDIIASGLFLHVSGLLTSQPHLSGHVVMSLSNLMKCPIAAKDFLLYPSILGVQKTAF